MTTSSKARPAASILALLLLGLSVWAEPALAQQPSQAQVSAIRSACLADFQANCAGVQPGGSAVLACLKKNAAALSPACQKAVAAVGGASAPTEKASEAPAVQPTTTAAPVSGAAVATPNAPVPTAAPAESAAPQVAPGATAPGVELALLRRACGPDYQANCPGVRPGGGRAIACLVAKQDALSPRCRRALAAARQGM
jgi:hypothetical protein